MYFANQDRTGLRLSVEGSQLIGNQATKNVLILNQEQTNQWFSGEDIKLESNLQGFVLIKHKDDFLGCGNFTQGTLHNYLGKERRIKIKEYS